MNEIDTRPICIDLFCGLGGWSSAFIDEGYRCIGYDIEAHDYGTGGYPGELILRDVTTIHGSEFKDAACIVASPPCQRYSYMAMPWSRAKAQAAMIEADTTGEELRKLNLLFDTCFRLQREASEAAGHHIPMIVENVRGAQKWVGRSPYHYGSFYLWGDVPALMPVIQSRKTKTVGHANIRDGHTHTRHLTNQVESDALYADRDSEGTKQHGSGHVWYRTGNGALPSASPRRKAASAMIAKIPYPLASWTAKCFKPEVSQ